MVEVVGDPILPSQLIVPSDITETKHNKRGAVFISGAKLYFHDGTSPKLITSA